MTCQSTDLRCRWAEVQLRRQSYGVHSDKSKYSWVGRHCICAILPRCKMTCKTPRDAAQLHAWPYVPHEAHDQAHDQANEQATSYTSLHYCYASLYYHGKQGTRRLGWQMQAAAQHADQHGLGMQCIFMPPVICSVMLITSLARTPSGPPICAPHVVGFHAWQL